MISVLPIESKTFVKKNRYCTNELEINLSTDKRKENSLNEFLKDEWVLLTPALTDLTG